MARRTDSDAYIYPAMCFMKSCHRCLISSGSIFLFWSIVSYLPPVDEGGGAIAQN